MSDAAKHEIYAFEGFRLDPNRRLLIDAEGQPVPIKPKVFDTLAFLVERSGEVLDKGTLMQAVWGDVVVEENSLNQHISTLRQVFGETPGENRFIVTVPGRGYRFVAPVEAASAPSGDRGAATGPSEIAATKAVRFTGRRIAFVIIGVLVLAVGFLLVRPPGTGPTPAPLIPDSIAVLPLDDLSPDPENAFYAPGIHAEIITQLQKIRNLAVISRESVMAFADDRPSLAEVAATLRVESLLTGSLQYANGRIRLVVYLVDPPTGTIIWSRDYQESFADIFAVQADIATNVANELAVEFTNAEREEIERPPTESLEAQTLYLAAKAAGFGDVVRYSQLIDETLEADDTFVEAWHERSVLDSYFGDYERAWEAAQKALELSGGEYALAYAVQGVVRMFQGRWIEAEQHYRDAFERGLEPDSIPGFAYLHMIVGRFDEAIAEAEAYLAVNPMDATTATFLLATYEIVGDQDGWQRIFDRGERLYDVGVWPAGYERFLIPLADRDHELLRSLATEASARGPIDAHENALILGASKLDSPASGIEALRALHDELDLSGSASDNFDDRVAIFSLSAWAAFFGDSEQAIEWLEEALPLSPIQLQRTWYPIFASVRQEPGFEQLLTDLGLPEYWDMYGWPETCRQVDEEDFECN